MASSGRGFRTALLCFLALIVGAVLAVIPAGLLYKPATFLPDGVAGRLLKVGGVPVRVHQVGSGRDVLFIHGSSGMLEDFDRQAEDLAKDFRVTRYDRPGHGYSGDSGRYGLADNSAVATQLIARLGLRNVIVVGHSYGGATALKLALQPPAAASAYVVLDAAPYQSLREPEPLFQALELNVLGQGLARLVPESRRQEQLAAGIAKEFVGTPPEGFVALRARVWSEPKVLHAMAWEHRHFSEQLAQQNTRYGAIRAPLYVVTQPARAASARKLTQEVAGAELVELANTGHYVQVERAAEVNALIRRIAAGQDATAAAPPPAP